MHSHATIIVITVPNQHVMNCVTTKYTQTAMIACTARVFPRHAGAIMELARPFVTITGRPLVIHRLRLAFVQVVIRTRGAVTFMTSVNPAIKGAVMTAQEIVPAAAIVPVPHNVLMILIMAPVMLTAMRPVILPAMTPVMTSVTIIIAQTAISMVSRMAQITARTQ